MLYRHYKGTVYRLVTIARAWDDQQHPRKHYDYVVYEDWCNPERRWIRPAHEFFGMVDAARRFQPISEDELS